MKREQIGYFIVAAAVGFFGGATNWFIWYKIPIPPYLNILIAVYITITAYAITKTELMDIRVVITRTVAYGLVSILLIASFVVLNAFCFPILITMILNALLALFWAWGAHRLRAFIQTPLEEKWITGWYDSDKLINNVAQKLIPVMEREEVFKIIAEQLKSSIKIKSVDIAMGKPEEEYKDLTKTKKGLVIPLSSSDGIEGILLLGQKVSEDPYSDKDLTIFRTIMIQVQAIFDRIRPYENVKKDFEANQKKLYDTERLLTRSERIASLANLIREYNHEIKTPLFIFLLLLKWCDLMCRKPSL